MGISLSGLGSGFDWKNLVSQLNDAEVQQKITPLKTQQSKEQSKLTAWQSLGTKLSTLQNAMDDLKDSWDFNVYKATLSSSSDTVTADSLLSATPGTTAGSGKYDIVVSTLAKGEQVTSSATFGGTSGYTLNSSVGATGNLKINGTDLGSLSGKSLNQIRDLINGSKSTTNVTASIIQVTSGTTPTYKLSLSNDTTGQTEGAINLDGSTSNIGGTGLFGSSTYDSASIAVADADTQLGYSGHLSINGKEIADLATGGDSGNPMTLNELKEAINAASGDTGVSAAIVGTSSSYKLRLTSPKDGIAYSFNDDAGQALATNPMDFSSTAVHSSADATLQVNGTTITRTNNTITDIIPGVTLSLKKQDPATTVTVDVEKDAQSISSKVTKFVNAYNDVLSTIQKQSTYNAEAKSTGGVLFGDPTMKAIKNKIQNVVLNARSSSGDALSNLGLEFNSSGKLTFDSTEFETALETNASETVSFFNTFAASLSTALDTYTDSIDGAVTTRKKGIQSSIDLLTKKINTTQDRIDRQMALLTDQFIKMDSAVGDMQTQASYVAAQLGT